MLLWFNPVRVGACNDVFMTRLCRFCELCKHRFQFAPSKSSLSLSLFFPLFPSFPSSLPLYPSFPLSPLSLPLFPLSLSFPLLPSLSVSFFLSPSLSSLSLLSPFLRLPTYPLLSPSRAVYRQDMPNRLPLTDIIGGITVGTLSSMRRWCHLSFVAFMWLILVPICTCESIIIRLIIKRLCYYMHVITCVFKGAYKAPRILLDCIPYSG